MLLISFFMNLSLFGQAVEWPSKRIVGVIGASKGSCQAPVNSPLGGIGYAGCSYEALDISLTKRENLDEEGFSVQNTAQGGARSYDIIGTGWKGYMSQYNELYARTTWPFDGNNRLSYVVVSTVNDCLHSIVCSRAEMESILIQNIVNVANLAQTQGVKLVVNGYANWADLDLQRAAQIFGLVNIISESDFEFMRTKYKETLSAHSNVIFLEPWDNNFHSIDGLHPIQEDVKKAAKIISKKIVKDWESDKSKKGRI